ncbi:pentapeptide repeat-containing protein [Streptomyces sp. SYP-A7185]|uniref:pentapeptide repeat-containing protein n=1 Tax=Streptomyces sp. SYP-A7185 TaxID=3040076 RepID=UPI0038F70A3B
MRQSNAQAQEDRALAREGQITERYTAAVSNLGADAMDVRLGGIYALQRIMQDSSRDQPTINNVLAAYARSHAAKAPPAGKDVPADVLAALKVLSDRDTTHDEAFVLDLTSIWLPGADLAPSRLQAFWLPDAGTSSSKVNTKGIMLRSAILTKAHLSGAFLPWAELRRASLNDADLERANLGHADLRIADLSHADLRKAVLIKTDLGEANLVDADLRGATMRAVRLSSAEAGEADLRGADLRCVDVLTTPTPPCSDLRDASLFYSDLRGANLRGADLRGADLSGADLRGADLRCMDVQHKESLVKSHCSKLRGADLTDTDLRGTDLTHVGLARSDIDLARIDGTTKLP